MRLHSEAEILSGECARCRPSGHTYFSRNRCAYLIFRKTEKGETKKEALIRECREEIGVAVSVGDIFFEVDHEYPDIFIHLTLFNCSIASGEIRMLEHNDIKWITPDEIPQYEFCPADKDILEKLMRKRDKYGNC